MDLTDLRGPGIGALVAVLLLGTLAVPVQADVLPPHCIGRDGHEPTIGDGPLAGDAPSEDGPHQPPGPCYTGQLRPYVTEVEGVNDTPSDDADHFVLDPPGSLWYMEVFALEGCGNVTITLRSNGATSTDRICADGPDDTAWWGILTFSLVDMTIHDGDLVYAFHHPIPGV